MRWPALVMLTVGCAADTPETVVWAPTTTQDCNPASDLDGDGLDDCMEAELGTDADHADSDTDGVSDGDEVACGSDPTDTEERCYACGWSRRDLGDLEAGDGTPGSTMPNLSLIDQCAERVALWDLAGTWKLLFMTASWCAPCLDEAEGFNARQAAVQAQTGQDFAFLTVIFEDSTGQAPSAAEGAEYAARSGIEGQPVFADPVAAVLSATSYAGTELPGVCILDPRMTLVDCAQGEGAVDTMLATVQAAMASAPD